jgi:rubrerythrin
MREIEYLEPKRRNRVMKNVEKITRKRGYPINTEEIIIKFKAKRARRIMLMLISILVVLAISFGNYNKAINLSNEILTIIMLVIVATNVILALVDWKCPNCGAGLPNTLSPSRCWVCKVKLR